MNMDPDLKYFMYIRWTFDFMDIDFKVMVIGFTNIAYNLKSTNSSVHEHVPCHQTTKSHAYEIK